MRIKLFILINDDWNDEITLCLHHLTRNDFNNQDQVGTMARTLKAILSKSNVKEKLKTTSSMLVKLRHLAQEPQHALPDVFLWLIQNNKRVAYHRIPAKDIIYSLVEEEKGRHCAKVQTLFLKVSYHCI